VAKALELRALNNLLIHEDIDLLRVVMKFKEATQQSKELLTKALSFHPNILGEKRVIYLTPEQLKDPKYYKEKETKLEMEVVEVESFIDWLQENNLKKQEISIHIVTSRSSQGVQFQKSFGGIAGMLRYELDFDEAAYHQEEDEEEDIEEGFI